MNRREVKNRYVVGIETEGAIWELSRHFGFSEAFRKVKGGQVVVWTAEQKQQQKIWEA